MHIIISRQTDLDPIDFVFNGGMSWENGTMPVFLMAVSTRNDTFSLYPCSGTSARYMGMRTICGLSEEMSVWRAGARYNTVRIIGRKIRYLNVITIKAN